MRLRIDSGEPPCVHWVAQHVDAALMRLERGGQRNVPSRILAGSALPQIRALLERHPQTPKCEGFVIDRADDDPRTLVVASSHFRGTMFGLLEVCRLLGVDPLEYFTDAPPRPVDVETLSFPMVSPGPAFRYRGAFINQEDLLAGWMNADGPIPLEVYDQIFLTLLRLGANTVIPGTYVSPDSPILDLASERGLVLAQLHFQVVGTDVGRLTGEQKRCYSLIRHRQQTIDIWRQSIRRNRHRDTIWTLGYRGLDDQPFWRDEGGDFSDQRKGEVISEAIRVQRDLLREELGEDAPCVFYLYRENQVLYQSGHVDVPDGVSLIWCDNGYGTMESYFRGGYELWGMTQLKPIPAFGTFAPAWPAEKQSGGGVYYHVSFYDGAAPNRVQYVSPAAIQRNLSEAARRGLDGFMLLNVGNVREFVLGIAAAFDFARAPGPWVSDPDHHRRFLEAWCAAHGSEALAPEAADVYEQLFQAHWHWSTSPGKCFGDNAVQWLMPDVIHALLGCAERSWMGDAVVPEMTVERFTELIASEGGQSVARWEAAVAAAETLLPKLPQPGRQFFFENVVVQTRRGLDSAGVLARSAQAVVALRRGDENTCRTALDDAARFMDAWEQALSATDRAPRWRTWSKADRIVLPHVVRQYLNAVVALTEARLAGSKNDLHDHLKRGTASAP